MVTHGLSPGQGRALRLEQTGVVWLNDMPGKLPRLGNWGSTTLLMRLQQ